MTTATLTPKQRETYRRLRSDFPFYASRCLNITSKEGKTQRLTLNQAQLYLHERLESQKRLTGRVRALIVKGRQQGCSTYTEARFFHLVTTFRGRSAYILTHHDDATSALFDMAKGFYEGAPLPVRPSQSAANAKELYFDKLGSGYKVGTAGGRATGRGQTFQLFHGSEVAYWPNGEAHVAGALQAVADLPGTEIILESTSAGRAGLFYAMCDKAMRGEGDYELIFIPWFWQTEYRKPPPAGFHLTQDELDYQALYGLDLEQMAWRRSKIGELLGIGRFRREYPATAAEAFSAEAEGALWTRERIDLTRVSEAPRLTRVVVAIDPSGGGSATNDEVGIVAAGLGEDGRCYVLADRSGRYRPAEWGRMAVQLYHELEADRIVAEVNFGGDMVETVVRTADENVPYKSVTASRGKKQRAEPIAALYEQGRVSHVGNLISLEDEMVTWDPIKATWSPGRMDALVWAATDLMLEDSTTGVLEYYRGLRAKRDADNGRS